MSDTINDPRQLDWIDEIQRERDRALARSCLKPKTLAAQMDKGTRKYEPRRADA